MDRLAVNEPTVTLADFMASPGVTPNGLADATNGRRLIHAAAAEGSLDALGRLLDAGAEIGARTRNGDSVLHVCARSDKLACLRLLLDRGADVNATNQAKETPLHLAVAAKQLEIVRELLSHDADCSLEDAYGDLALHVACFAEDCHAARLVVKAGPEFVNKQNASGNTPLHIAALCENPELLALLLRHGADFNVMDANGKTAIDLLTETGDTSGIDCLGRQIIRDLRHFVNAENMAQIVSSREGGAYLDHLLHIDGLCSSKLAAQIREADRCMQLEMLESVITKRKVDADRLIRELQEAFNAGLRADLESSGILCRAAWKVVQLVLFPQNEPLLQRLVANRSLWSSLSRHIELSIDHLYAKALRKMKAGVRELLRRNCTDESGVKIDFVKMNKFLARITSYWSFSKRPLMFDMQDSCSDNPDSSCHKRPMRDPLQSLVMWAILTGRLRLVPTLLRQEEFDLVPLALLATTVLRSLSHRRDIEDVFVDKAGRVAEICEGMAIQVIKEVKEVDNSPNNSLTISYVSLPLPNYAGYNILDLSARGCASEFIKLDIVELATDKNWYGDFFDFSSVLTRELVIVSGFLPPFMLLLPRLIKRYRRPGTRSFLETVLNDPTDTVCHAAILQNDTEAQEKAQELVQLLPVSGKNNKLTTEEDEVHRPHRHNGLMVRAVDYMKEMLLFYRTPCVKFRLHAIFYFVFVSLLSSMILHDFQGTASSTEIFCYFALLGIFVEELREMIAACEEETLLVYISDGWNAIDLVAISCGFLAFVTRQFSPASRLSTYVIGHGKAAQDMCYILIVVTTLIFWIRILFISIVLESVGVKLKMLSLMIKKDFIPFLYILFVIMLGFGIAFHALLWPNGQYIGSNGKAIQLPAYDILIEMFHRTFYTIVGEYGLDDMQNVCKRNETNGEPEDSVEKCVESPGNVLVPYVLMVAYIVIVQVLLLNVIVAMFSKTIDMVDSSQSLCGCLSDTTSTRSSSSAPPCQPR
ncbi:hypothetical protein BOX15_Mlig004154g2 [Macrostomum lignano]|uniref:Ion transport domain-containing protein n=1 Tax=Macrostomum lignano TaxID=282301 RepID=A0A267DV29_9PLAT|nr:hypothetical protein BOX15_Mlig004154g2 [Macrostomum lignano]